MPRKHRKTGYRPAKKDISRRDDAARSRNQIRGTMGTTLFEGWCLMGLLILDRDIRGY